MVESSFICVNLASKSIYIGCNVVSGNRVPFTIYFLVHLIFVGPLRIAFCMNLYMIVCSALNKSPVWCTNKPEKKSLGIVLAACFLSFLFGERKKMTIFCCRNYEKWYIVSNCLSDWIEGKTFGTRITWFCARTNPYNRLKNMNHFATWCYSSLATTFFFAFCVLLFCSLKYFIVRFGIKNRQSTWQIDTQMLRNAHRHLCRETEREKGKCYGKFGTHTEQKWIAACVIINKIDRATELRYYINFQNVFLFVIPFFSFSLFLGFRAPFVWLEFQLYCCCIFIAFIY